MCLKSSEKRKRDIEGYKYYEKADFMKLCEIVNRLKGTKHSKINEVWDIPVKTNTAKYSYEDGEMTE